MNSDGNNSCKFGGDLLAYLYNEMSADGRDRLETHLADCEACTDEFAELSLARYSVYEWQKLEFAPLETPEIVIPFDANTAGVSWFDKVVAAFALSNKWATVGAAFAVLAVVAIGGFFVVNRDSGVEVVKEVNVEPSPMRTPSPSAANTQEQASKRTSERDATTVEKVDGISTTDRKAVAVPVSAGSVPKKTPRSSVNNRNRSAPRLNDFDDDEEDKSLRLTDIFDDLDTLE